MNKGLIETISPYAYIEGYNSPLIYEARNLSGDWTPYLPMGEIQYGREDYMDCVSRSLTNIVEIQEKFLTGKEVNYSDRFLAKRSGTTKEGNYCDKVMEFASEEGLVLQSNYGDTGGTFNEQYADIPEPLLSQLLTEGQ